MRLHYTIFLSISFSIITLFCVSTSVSALTLVDLRQEVIVDPGGDQLISVDFFNETAQKVIVSPEIDSFTVDEKTGRALFGAKAEVELWVQPSDAITIESGQTGTLSFIVRVPGSAEPNTHYLGLFGAQVAVPGQVGISTRVGSLVFLQIAGTQQEGIVVREFAGVSSVFFEAPIAYALRVENTGSVRVALEGTVKMTDMYGRTIASGTINKEGRFLFAGMTKQEDGNFTDIHWKHAGPLTLSLFVKYGITGQNYSDTTTIWFIPWQGIVAALLTVLLLLTHTIYWRRRRSKKK